MDVPGDNVAKWGILKKIGKLTNEGTIKWGILTKNSIKNNRKKIEREKKGCIIGFFLSIPTQQTAFLRTKRRKRWRCRASIPVLLTCKASALPF